MDCQALRGVAKTSLENLIDARQRRKKVDFMTKLAQETQTQFETKLQAGFDTIDKEGEELKDLAEKSKQTDNDVKDACSRFAILKSPFVSNVLRQHFVSQDECRTPPSPSSHSHVNADELVASQSDDNADCMVQSTSENGQLSQGSIDLSHEHSTLNTSKLAYLDTFLILTAFSKSIWS